MTRQSPRRLHAPPTKPSPIILPQEVIEELRRETVRLLGVLSHIRSKATGPADELVPTWRYIAVRGRPKRRDTFV
jgi:hypothetical protein